MSIPKISAFSLRRSQQQGLTLLEVIVSLGIISTATIGMNMIASRYSDDTKVTIAASQTRTFGEAAKAYIKDNYAAIQAVATPTAPAMVDVPTLVASGHLTTGFLSTNAYGQSLCALVLEPIANRLQAMVLAEGGTVIDDLSLGNLAAIVGGSGGGTYSTSASVIRGAVGGWEIPIATFDNRVNNVARKCDGTSGNVRVTAGTPAMALWFENGDTTSAFLARDAVPGRPELNAMNTPIVMNSVQVTNDACSNLGAIARSSTGAVLSCQAGLWKSQGASFWQDPVASFAALPACNVAAAWQTRLVQTPSVGTGPRAYSCNGSAWTALAVDDQGSLVVPRRIIGGGADAVHGALTIQGETNGWSGINFKQANGTNSGTLMMHPNNSGFYNAAQNNWRWYTDDGGNTWQYGGATLTGSLNTHDVYSRSTGHYLSSVSSCSSGWVWSGGTCQHISWYAPGVPAGASVVTNGGCPGGYYYSYGTMLLDAYGNFAGYGSICTKA